MMGLMIMPTDDKTLSIKYSTEKWGSYIYEKYKEIWNIKTKPGILGRSVMNLDINPKRSGIKKQTA
jgi:hypothetical protein